MPHSVAEIGLRHRGKLAGGNLRAAVFGASDGLVSNVCLILGVSGAHDEGHLVLISGVAGLLAGAFSMAAGEYVSVRSQREMFEHQIGAEREELQRYPAEEAAELSLIYQARGLGKDDADRMAGRIVANPGYALDALAREELGLDPGALGSPLAAATFSFVSFAVGAAVPLAPFVVAAGLDGAVGRDRVDRGDAVRRRLRDQLVHRPRGGAGWRADAGDWSGGGRGDVRDRSTAGRRGGVGKASRRSRSKR